MLVLAADHGGYMLKNDIAEWLKTNGYEYIDCGTNSLESVDYPVYAKLGVDKILSGECSMGIFCCGTGIGISMAANRFKGIRAAVCESEVCAEMARRHNNANVLCLGGRTTGKTHAIELVKIFLTTEFDGGERHRRRIAMLDR